jgi:hypothetical protein
MRFASPESRLCRSSRRDQRAERDRLDACRGRLLPRPGRPPARVPHDARRAGAPRGRDRGMVRVDGRDAGQGPDRAVRRRAGRAAVAVRGGGGLRRPARLVHRRRRGARGEVGRRGGRAPAVARRRTSATCASISAPASACARSSETLSPRSRATPPPSRSMGSHCATGSGSSSRRSAPRTEGGAEVLRRLGRELRGFQTTRPAGFEPATSRSGGERSIH